MIWNKHYTKTEHAFLSASKYHWINYDEAKLKDAWRSFKAAQEGTELHKWAADTIRLGIRQRRSNETILSYINDAIGFRMTPEVLLYYSENCFGTADAIAFDEKEKFLRIHDLKTGKTPASFKQLEIYAALFCLEYDVNPSDIDIRLRIYQLDEILEENPDPDIILSVMDKIIEFDRIVAGLRKEG